MDKPETPRNLELEKYLRDLFDKTADAYARLDYPERVSRALVAVYAYGQRHAGTRDHAAKAARESQFMDLERSLSAMTQRAEELQKKLEVAQSELRALRRSA